MTDGHVWSVELHLTKWLIVATVYKQSALRNRLVIIITLSTYCTMHGHDLDQFADLNIARCVSMLKNATNILANMMPE